MCTVHKCPPPLPHPTGPDPGPDPGPGTGAGGRPLLALELCGHDAGVPTLASGTVGVRKERELESGFSLLTPGVDKK
eukprot:scaffold31904_cov60-Cyclotella_meneghiniana.AAC.1